MTSQKKIIILGTHTLFSDNYFINDEAPRMLARLIEDGYKVELLKTIPEEFNLEIIQMPFWLRDNMMVLEELNKNEKYHKESFAIIDDIGLAKEFKLNIPIYTNFFKPLTFDKFNIVDLLICFGFEGKEFKNFCKTNNLLGVDNGVFINSTKNSQAVAVSVDTDNTKETSDYAMSKFKLAVKNGLYKVKHDHTLMGITFKGRGISTEVGYTPLLFI